MSKLREHLRRNGWLLAALGLCVIACLLLSAYPNTGDTRDRSISRVLSAMEGAGEVQVAIHYDQQAIPCGAVVLAEGASSIGVRLQLTNAVSTLLGLDPAAVAVYPLKGGSP